MVAGCDGAPAVEKGDTKPLPQEQGPRCARAVPPQPGERFSLRLIDMRQPVARQVRSGPLLEGDVTPPDVLSP